MAFLKIKCYTAIKEHSESCLGNVKFFFFTASIDQQEKSVKLKMPPNTRWKLKIQTEIRVKEIVVDSSGASNGISINTTGGGSTEGISVEQLADEGEFELHKSFEESGKSNSSTQLVCSGQFSTEKKPSK